jgi:hypothetical protein
MAISAAQIGNGLKSVFHGGSFSEGAQSANRKF